MASAIDDCPVWVLVSLKLGWRSPLEAYTLCLAWYRVSTSRQENANGQIYRPGRARQGAETFVGPTLAQISMLIGEHDAAIDRLDHLLSVPSIISVPLLRLDPLWDPLRSHSRFQALLAKYEN